MGGSRAMPPAETNAAPLPSRPLGETVGSLLAAWLIPGLGHILHRDVLRGIFQFVLIQVTFGLGLLLHGAVLWPAYNPLDWGANAMNILTFVIQLANGLAALLCLAVSQAFPGWAEATRAHALFELGSVYLLISGAMNSFTVGALFDRHLRWGRAPLPPL
ncbi:MAG: hypothetical protein HUU25_00565 [Candidatus Sumerlaeia bacterium]|nr:hypothetical protein [Candidatus Sumerlaeia bacterium]